MKLDEIIDAQIIRKQADSESLSLSRRKPTKLIGSGAFSYVSQSINPHEVNKTSRGLVGEGDITIRYLNYIAEHNIAAENPYFPRVYKGVLVQSEGGRHYYHYNVEKLQRIMEFTPDEIIAACYRVLNMEKIKAATGRNMEDDPTVLFAWFVSKSKDIFMGNSNDGYIQDEHAVQAVEIIRKIAMSYGNILHDVGWDVVPRLDTGNILGRRTSLGLQFVFMDPLCI